MKDGNGGGASLGLTGRSHVFRHFIELKEAILDQKTDQAPGQKSIRIYFHRKHVIICDLHHAFFIYATAP
jgi:hypothetical protein